MAAGLPPDSQDAMESSVDCETPPGRDAKASRRSRSLRRPPSDRIHEEASAGTASARPIRVGVGSPSGAAMAAAGMASAMKRTKMEYVRFVSKRGTVAGFRAPQSDRAH